MSQTPLPNAGLLLWPTEVNLLHECAKALLTQPRERLRHTCVVLPTRRLALHLLSALADWYGALIPPTITTFDGLLERLARSMAIDIPVSASNAAIEVFLAQELRERGFLHVTRGMEHEILYFLGECVESDLDKTVYQRLTQVLNRDIYRDEQTTGALRDRLRELQTIEDALRGHLLGERLRLAPETRRHLTRSIQHRLAASPSAPLPFDRIELVGFTTVASVYRPLLADLASRSDCRLWLNTSPLQGDVDNPLQELANEIGARGTTHRMTPKAQTPPKEASSPILIHEASGLYTEISAALATARHYIDSGIEPSRVALVLTDESLYAPLVAPLLKAEGLNANIAMGIPLAATPTGQWWASLMDLLTSGEEALHTLAWCLHPWTVPVLDQDVTPRPEDDLPAAHRLISSLCRADLPKGLEALARGIDDARVVETLTTLRERLRGWIDHDHPAPRPLRTWIHDWTELTAPFAPDASEDLRARERLLSRLAESASLARRPATRGEFFQLIRDHALSDTLPPATDALSGLQVLSVPEARGVPFSVTLILGCREGSFPRAVPADTLLDSHLKTSAGLSGLARFERIEDMTFGLLAAQTPRLHLFYPRECLGEKTTRSRFIERVLTEGRGIIAPLPSRPQSSSSLSPPTESLPEGDFDMSARREMLSHMSATSLERLIRCPYAFLLHRLRLRPLDLPSAATDTREESVWLHAVLEAFFTGKGGGQTLMEPLPLDWPVTEFETRALERLTLLSERLAPGPIPAESLIQTRQVAWPAFVNHWRELLQKSGARVVGDLLKEFHKELDLHPKVSIGGLEVTLDGRFDSVDALTDFHLITDYKRQGLPDSREITLGIAPQLPFYALTLEKAFPSRDRMAADRSLLGYWSINKGAFEVVAAGSKALAPAQGLSLVGARGKITTGEILRRVTKLWTWRQEDFLTRARPITADPDSCGYCAFEGVCRKADPRHRERVASQTALSTRARTIAEGEPS